MIFKIFKKIDYKNNINKIVIDIDLENNISTNLLENNECLFCFEIMEKEIKICDKCNYKICFKCYELYIKKYKYKKCPQCRDVISIVDTDNSISTRDSAENNCFKEICLVIYKLIVFIILIILCIILGSKIMGDKGQKIIVYDLFVGWIFFGIILMCLIRYFCAI